jgi:hypothetical protein
MEAPAYDLYSPVQIGGATFLGSFPAACVLMARNYRRLGMASSAAKTLYCGLTATAALIVVSLLLPSDFPAWPIGLACTLGMYQAARQLQGRAFAEHVANGGHKASTWSVIGVALLSLCAMLVVFAAVFLMLPEDSL